MSGDNQIGWCVMAPDETVFLDERYAYLDNAQLAAERMRRRYGAGYRVVEVVWREVHPLDGEVVAWMPLEVAPEKDGEQ